MLPLFIFMQSMMGFWIGWGKRLCLCSYCRVGLVDRILPSCSCLVPEPCWMLSSPMDCSTPGFPVLHCFPVCSHSYPLIWWCRLIISSSVVPFSSCLQSFPALGSFLMSQLFASGGQTIGASASASILPMEYSVLISFRMDWLDLLAVQGTLKSLLQH